MSIYTIADLHLFLGVGEQKSMHIFGHRWQGHIEKLEKNWRAIVDPEDSVIIPGDISWALGLEEALEDLKFIDSLPGTKYIGKGNHDFWWATYKKIIDFFELHNITTIKILYNCAYEVEDYVICGTRGWFYDDGVANIPEGTDFDKIINREVQRLRISLEEGKRISQTSAKPMLCFIHFPVVWNGMECEPLMNVLLEYGIKKCYFGHIHGSYSSQPCFEHKGVTFSIISADYLNFVPRIIFPPDFD